MIGSYQSLTFAHNRGKVLAARPPARPPVVVVCHRNKRGTDSKDMQQISRRDGNQLGHLVAVGDVLLSRPTVVVKVQLGAATHEKTAGLTLEQEKVYNATTAGCERGLAFRFRLPTVLPSI